LGALVLVTSVAAALRFSTISRQSFWYDETITVWLLKKSFTGMLTTIPRSESTPPLYYICGWVWTQVFGTSEAGVRSFSAVVGTLTVPVVYAIGRALLSHRVGLIAAWITTVNPFLVWYSQEARSYALLAFLGAISLLCAARAQQTSTVRALAAWATFATLAMGTHYFAFFLVAAEAVWLVTTARTRRSAVALIALIVAAAGVLTPLAVFQARVVSTAWIHNDFSFRLRSEWMFVQLLGIGRPAPWAGVATTSVHPAWIAAGAILLALCGILLVTRAKPDERSRAALVGALGAATIGAPVLIAIFSSLFGRTADFVLDRNLIHASIPVTIVVASAMGARRAGRAGIAIAAIFCASSLSLTIVSASDSRFQREDLRSLARLVSGPEKLVVVTPARAARSLEVYAPELTQARRHARDVREIDVVTRGSANIDGIDLPSTFRPRVRKSFRSWLLTSYRSTRASAIGPEIFIRPAQPGGSDVMVLEPRSARR
jgi:uncharacterized membrane protein